MKKIFTYSITPIIMVILFTGCIKDRFSTIDENYWLSKERGTVVYSSTCSYFVVDTYNGYAIVRGWNGYKPYQGDILYGNFSNYGTRNFYNRSEGSIFSAEVVEYWLTYDEAQSALNYYCP
ncbi:MAG: hypothetical protein JST17_15215 [Bacteroidetes bacterium]|nr:hypothetical protein [Bacteroidota bacterium]MBS1930261.1 hypothetical protein [Bacteroidota bacterium]